VSSKRAIIKTFKAIGLTTGINPAKVSGAMSADIVGPTTTIDVVDQVCFQVAWTSSNAVGVISVQGSVDGETFSDLTFTTALAQPASNSSGYLINLALIPFTYIRVKYTRTSGTGNMTVSMSVKGV
jgi:hypothetical protein